MLAYCEVNLPRKAFNSGKEGGERKGPSERKDINSCLTLKIPLLCAGFVEPIDQKKSYFLSPFLLYYIALGCTL